MWMILLLLDSKNYRHEWRCKFHPPHLITVASARCEWAIPTQVLTTRYDTVLEIKVRFKADRSQRSDVARSVCLSVYLSVCVFVTRMSPAKTAKLIAIPFEEKLRNRKKAEKHLSIWQKRRVIIRAPKIAGQVKMPSFKVLPVRLHNAPPPAVPLGTRYSRTKWPWTCACCCCCCWLCCRWLMAMTRDVCIIRSSRLSANLRGIERNCRCSLRLRTMHWFRTSACIRIRFD